MAEGGEYGGRWKNSKTGRLPLAKTIQISLLARLRSPVLRLLHSLLRRPPVRMGRVDNARIRRTAIRNAQFVSFVDASGCFDRRQPDRFDRRLRRQKLVKGVLSLAAAGGLGWVVLESARAISRF